MAIDPNANPGAGIAFSPIPAEKTLEDLPALLARIFGGPGGGLLSRLPGLNVKGAPPDEILKAFLAGLPSGGTRPDIGEVIAPEHPLIPGGPGPDVGTAPVPNAPPPGIGIGAPEAGGPAPAPDLSIPGPEPGAPEPALPSELSAGPASAPSLADALQSPPAGGPTPSYEGRPGVPGGPAPSEMSPEEKAFLEELFGGQPEMGVTPVV